LRHCARRGFADGIGFVFSANDPYCGIDLDNIWQSDADEGAEWAQGILEQFADTYGEGSPSGRGYKTWCRRRRRVAESGRLERARLRFMTMADSSRPATRTA
jgi:primase-polymerase (primpol)-like protein